MIEEGGQLESGYTSHRAQAAVLCLHYVLCLLQYTAAECLSKNCISCNSDYGHFKGVWNQWNGMLEWNGGMEHWNGIAKWFFLQNNITQLGLEYCHVNYKVFHC